MKTAVIQFSEAEIKRQATGSALTLRDARYQGLRFRFTGNRNTGSWFLLINRSWKKVASYPQVSVKKMLEMLPELQAKAAMGEAVKPVAGQFATVGELLRWYAERVSKDRSLTEHRKASVASIIKVQLVPRIGSMSVGAVSREALDDRLMWPMQEQQALGYVRQCLRVLQTAFKRADALGLLEHNPMLGIRFSDFIASKIKPKAARLSMLELPELLSKLVGSFDTDPVISMLAIMQLGHGTRLGETRSARWRHISLVNKLWVIPAENTKTKTEHAVPLTERMCELLELYRARLGDRLNPEGAVFPQQLSGAVISAAQAQGLIRRLSGGDWSSHDLRKLARTGWVELGVDYLIGEMLLNHAMGFSAETYVNTSAAELKLDALTRWHALLDDNGLDALACDTDARRLLIQKSA